MSSFVYFQSGQSTVLAAEALADKVPNQGTDKAFPNKALKLDEDVSRNFISKPYDGKHKPREGRPPCPDIQYKTRDDLLWKDYDITPTDFSTRTNFMLKEIIDFMAQIAMRIETLVLQCSLR